MISLLVPTAAEALSTSLASRTFSEGPGYQGLVVFENLQSSRRANSGLLLRAGALELVSWADVTACSDGARKEQNHCCITDQDKNRMIWVILRLALL